MNETELSVSKGGAFTEHKGKRESKYGRASVI